MGRRMKLKFFSVAFPVATMTFLAAIGGALWFVAASFSEVSHALDQRKTTLSLTSELSRLTQTMSRLVRAFAATGDTQYLRSITRSPNTAPSWAAAGCANT